MSGSPASSFLAVSKLSLITRRCLSAPTGVSMVVSDGRQVMKKPRSRSATRRRIRRLPLWQILRPIDEVAAPDRCTGGENADLAFGHFAGPPDVLTLHAARRLALLREAGLIDDQHRVLTTKMLDDRTMMISRRASTLHRPCPVSPAAAMARRRLLPRRIHPVLRRSSRLAERPRRIARLDPMS